MLRPPHAATGLTPGRAAAYDRLRGCTPQGNPAGHGGRRHRH